MSTTFNKHDASVALNAKRERHAKEFKRRAEEISEWQRAKLEEKQLAELDARAGVETPKPREARPVPRSALHQET
ncbi:hypothetical protein HFU75_01045, partial [Acidithiobacillus sp. VAN18-2]|nr:hypothetical protein [Acidithiobacillus sp. VAN18-2]